MGHFIDLDDDWKYALPEGIDIARSREILKIAGYPENPDTLYVQCAGKADIPFKIGNAVWIKTTNGVYNTSGKVWYIYKSTTQDIYNVYVRIAGKVVVLEKNTLLDSSGGVISLDVIPSITSGSGDIDAVEQIKKEEQPPLVKAGISPIILIVAGLAAFLVLRKLFK
jgi:hypothetical protein